MARLVFKDVLYVVTMNKTVSGEQRWQAVGQVDGATLLLVIHTVWEDETQEEIIRIISARRPSKRERQAYEGAHRSLQDG